MWKSLFVFIFFLQLWQADSRESFIGHRGIQYVKGGKNFGAQKATINHVVASPHAKDLKRHVALVRMEELTLDLLQSIKQRQAPALLVVLPADLTDVPPETLEEWKEIEQSLFNQELQMAIWFAFDCPELQNILKVLDNVEDRYHVSGSVTPKQIGKVKLTNFLGSIRGQGNAPTDRLKNILIVANYDTHAGVPTLSFGANDNASGLVSLLQLAAIFNRFYSQPSTHGSYNIMFLITGAGRFNFQGTRSWLENADATTSGILENIDFVLCLERLGRGEQLYLHVPQAEKDGYEHIHKIFKETATKFDIPFGINYIKRPTTGGISEWPHELLHRKQIFAATLSADSKPNILHARSTMFDRAELIDVDVLVRNIKFITEVMCRFAYNHMDQPELEVLTGQYQVNREFITNWLQYFSTMPRMSPYLSDSDLFPTLKEVLSEHTQDVMTQEFKFDMSFTKFFTSTPVQFSAYRVKNVWFDVTLSLCVCSYLLLLHLMFKAPKNAKELIDALKSVGRV